MLIYDPGSGDTSNNIRTYVTQLRWPSALPEFSYALTYFITNTASTEDILEWFWEGVRLLEEASFVEVAATMDESPSKQEISGRQSNYLS